MLRYAETVRPKAYRGSDPRKLAGYRRQCDLGRQIGALLDQVQLEVDSGTQQGRIISFFEVSDILGISIKDVEACLWNQSGGDTGITIRRSPGK